MDIHYEHKPLECPNCQSKNILKVILESDIIFALFKFPASTFRQKILSAIKKLLGMKVDNRFDYEKLLRSNKQESRCEAEELLRNHEAVVYDGENYIDAPAWKCTACNAYFLKDEYPPIRYVFKEKPLECPVCNSKRIADIQYGEPCSDKELSEQEMKGKVIIGGCCINDDSPSWRCYNCEQNLHREGAFASGRKNRKNTV